MAKEVDLDTKAKILEVSSKLFAEKGFSGTSVRDIANTAGVNLAAINYHFSNKNNLLKEVIRNGHEFMRNAVKKVHLENNYSFQDFCPVIFDVMMMHGPMVVNIMRILLSGESQDIENFETEDDFIGPTGGKTLYEILTEEVGETVDVEERFYVVHTIFGLMIHKALMLNSGACSRSKLKEVLTPELARLEIQKLATLLVNSLKTPH